MVPVTPGHDAACFRVADVPTELAAYRRDWALDAKPKRAPQ